MQAVICKRYASKGDASGMKNRHMCSDNWLPQIARPNRADRLGLKVVLPFLIQAPNWWTDTNDDRLFVETLSRRLKHLIIT